LIIPAIVFGCIGIGRANRGGSGKGMAIAGIILAVIATIAAVVILVIAVNHCSRDIDGNVHCSFSNVND
jgi:hypothetical protein